MPTDNNIGKSVSYIGVSLLIIYMIWLALTVTNNDKRIAVIESQMISVNRETSEIVPRSENERRYESLEKGQSQNAERIGRLEQYIYQGKH